MQHDDDGKILQIKTIDCKKKIKTRVSSSASVGYRTEMRLEGNSINLYLMGALGKKNLLK